jgi:hypothetical protein
VGGQGGGERVAKRQDKLDQLGIGDKLVNVLIKLASRGAIRLHNVQASLHAHAVRLLQREVRCGHQLSQLACVDCLSRKLKNKKIKKLE